MGIVLHRGLAVMPRLALDLQNGLADKARRFTAMPMKAVVAVGPLAKQRQMVRRAA